MTPSEGNEPEDGKPGLLRRLIIARPDEVPAVLGGFLLFFLLFASYFMLRPVRDTFAIAGGVDNIHLLFTATFVATIVVVPVYGLLNRHVARRRLLPAAYVFSAVVMTGFAFSLWVAPGDVWTARAFYVWLSVFNLFVISIAWSLMADVFRTDQAHRLFGQIAAGASLGGLTGPLLSAALVGPLGHAGLLLLSTALLLSTLACAAFLLRWSDRRPPHPSEASGAGPNAADPRPRSEPIGGSLWGGLQIVAGSRYLLGISLFVVLLTMATTFLYMQQARIVEATFPDPVRQTQVFAAIDATVQTLTIGIQLFVTGAVARWLGVRVLLVAVPLMMVLGFGLLMVVATFPVFAAVMVVRRVGEYAFVQPGREMLFAPLDAETKYKAKNAIDTVVYRGGDLVGAWVNSAIMLIGSAPLVAGVGAALAAVWAAVGYAIGSRHDRAQDGRPAPARAIA